MIQHQIDVFVYNLKNLATEYSNPAILMDHVPVLRDNPDMAYMGLGGPVAYTHLTLPTLLGARSGRIA